MLVITRKLNHTGESPGEDILYIGDDIKIQLVRLRGGTVGLGIEAPKHVKVLRAEIADAETRQRWGDDGKGGRR